MKLQLAKTDVPPTGPVDINGPGSAPALSFTKTGTGKVTLDNINIQNFTTYQADGTPANLGDFTCTLKPGQENTLFSFDIVDGGTNPEPDTTAPSVPANVSGTGTDDSASVKWDAATDNDGGSGVKGYYVTVDGQKRPDVVTGTETTVSGLSKGDHTFAVSAVDNAGNESAASAAITVAVPGDDTPPGDTLSYALAGTSTIKGGNGKVALSGSVSAKVDGSGKVAADLTLNPTTGKFSLFGFLPATADIAFAPQGQTTGTLSGRTLTTQTKTLVKVPSIKVFGLNIGGGDTCQASAPATIPLKSTDFSVAGGGTLTGEYTLPSLSGCGFLTPVISQLVAGGGNKIDLKATPKK
jgi:hypothetical protein